VKVLQAKKELCSQCYLCEEVCAQTLNKEKDRGKSAVRVQRGEDGRVEIITCNQCGECINICPVGAIYRAKSGAVLVKKSECVGCYACVGFCPRGAMFWHEEMVEPFKCTSCGKCARECPEGAVFLEEVISYS